MTNMTNLRDFTVVKSKLESTQIPETHGATTDILPCTVVVGDKFVHPACEMETSKTPSAFKKPVTCSSKPNIPQKPSQFLEVNLDEEFHALKSRSGSSSTPFIVKTSATFGSLGGLRKAPVLQLDSTSASVDASFNHSSSHSYLESHEQSSALHTGHNVCQNNEWTHIQLRGNELSYMNTSKLSAKASNTFSSPCVKPKRFSLANYSIVDSGFYELSSFIDNSSNASNLSNTRSSQSKLSSEVTQSFDDVLSRVTPAYPDRLVGRKMGLLKVDILSELKCRNMTACVSQILTYLSMEDLCRVVKVNADWKAIVKSDKRAYKRYQMQSLHLHGKENPTYASCKLKTTNNMSFSTGVLKAVQSSSDLTNTNSKPGAPQKSHSFPNTKELPMSSPDESFRRCPRCQSISSVHKVEERGRCQRSSCLFDFCVRCLDNFHGSRPCSLTMAIHSVCKTVATKKSKRNLKRL